MVVLGVDPGREKCGIAVVSKEEVLTQRVVSRREFLDVVIRLLDEYDVESIVLGDGTGSGEFLAEIRGALPDVNVETVDERSTSEEARGRYWIHHRPKGWRRLLPTTMQVPPEPYDDYVAVILAERYLFR